MLITSYRCDVFVFFFFQAEDGIRDLVRSRGLGDVYKRQSSGSPKDTRKVSAWSKLFPTNRPTRVSSPVRRNFGKTGLTVTGSVERMLALAYPVNPVLVKAIARTRQVVRSSGKVISVFSLPETIHSGVQKAVSENFVRTFTERLTAACFVWANVSGVS